MINRGVKVLTDKKTGEEVLERAWEVGRLNIPIKQVPIIKKSSPHFVYLNTTQDTPEIFLSPGHAPGYATVDVNGWFSFLLGALGIEDSDHSADCSALMRLLDQKQERINNLKQTVMTLTEQLSPEVKF